MAPPSKAKARAVTDDDDEDLDDLDGLAAEFTSSASISKPAAASSSSAPSRSSTTATTSSTRGAAIGGGDDEEDFPDPDDDELPDDLDDAALAKEIQDGMAQFLAHFGDGESSGANGEDAELKKVMQEIMAAGGAGGDAADNALLAALSGLTGGAATSGKGVGARSAAPTASGSGSGPSRQPAANFQDTIGATMNKMRDSGTTVDAETEARAAAADDPLAALLAQMAGLEGGLDGEGGIQGVLDEMMDQLMSRELLYSPLKELSDKYPAYLAENASKLSAEDLARYQKQQKHVAAIVAKFEEPGAEKEKDRTPAEEARHKARTQEITELVKEMNDCGAPPTEIMGEMPEGMELGPDGVPKLPTDCVIS